MAIAWEDVKMSEGRSPMECLIAAVKGTISKTKFSFQKISGVPNTTSSVILPIL